MRPSATVRERVEEHERSAFSTWATLSAESKGRDRHEEPDALRTAFQRDRDRLLHSQAFQRLGDKTHAFIPAASRVAGGRDRTRLTHTLEVMQIGRTIGRALRLNEDLIEATALGHDLGHAAFADAGERAFALVDGCVYRHHEHSVRVVERLERSGRGLNLTWEVRDGILHHPWSMAPATTAEGQVVRLANRIAVLTHDLKDALNAGLVHPEELPTAVVRGLGSDHGTRVASFVNDIVTSSEDQPEIIMSAAMMEIQDELREFVTTRITDRPYARAERDRAVHCFESLIVFYLENPPRLPRPQAASDPAEQQVVDHLADLGDRDLMALFREQFMPRVGPAG